MPSPDDKTTLDSDNILSDPDRVPENQLAVQVEQLDLKQPESADQEAQGGVLDPQLEYGKSDGEEEEEEEEEKHDSGADGEEQEEQKRNVNGSNESDKEGDDEEERWDDGRKNKFPVRPEAEDCAFYLKTGTCKFGSNCKFNHPPRRKLHVAAKERVKDKEESKEKTGQVECKYFSTPGGCKYGKSCRYNHGKASSVLPAVELNFLGLPVRLGEKECPFYMRTGTCKFAANCKFNHPDPMAGADPPMEYGNGGSSPLQNASQFPVWSPSMMYSPTQVVSSPNAEWNGYQFSSNPQPQGQSMLPPAAYIMNSPTTIGSHIHTNQQQQMGVDEFPERPGQPECSYFLKTGDCKFKSSCKYHHPKDQVLKSPQVALSDMGLPLRPGQNICSYYSRYGICKGQNICSYYSRYGICKFGPACKFDHSMQLAPSELERQPSTENSLGEDDPTIGRQVKDRR